MVLRWFSSVVMFIAGVSVMLAVLEVFLRGAEVILPALNDVDPVIGSTMRPGADFIFLKDGFGLGMVNSHGYLGPDYPEHRINGTLRIALVGDSYVEGMYVFDRHHFRSIMERELERTTGRKVEVQNFGRAGFRLSDMFCYYRNFVAGYRPDIVLFFLHAANLNSVPRPFGPACILRDSTLTISEDFRNSAEFISRQRTRWLRGRFSLFALYSNCRINAESGLMGRIFLDKLYPAMASGEIPPEDAPLPRADSLSAVDRAIVGNLAGLNRSGDAPAILIVNMGLPPRAVSVIRSLGITLFDPSGALDNLRAAGINPHYWKATGKLGHWNQDANRAVGLSLAQQIMDWLRTVSRNRATGSIVQRPGAFSK